MNYADIKKADLNNGEGIRVSLWVTGCPIRCEGCHNKDIWDPNTGEPFTKDTLEYLLNLFRYEKIDKNLSILGGEPLARYNVDVVTKVCKAFKTEFPNKTIWLWTGYDYEDVKDLEIMQYIDKLIDGRYISKLAKALWRGSNNQRIIGINKNREEKRTMKTEKLYENQIQKLRGFEPVKYEAQKSHKNKIVRLPEQKTKDSAGYDFYLPHDIILEPGEQITVWTDVKAYMQPNEFLDLNVRSSSGIKLGLVLANTRGIIDADYYENEANDGNIGICIKNTKAPFKLLGYEKVEVLTDVNVDCNSKTVRTMRVPIIEDLTEINTIHLKEGQAIAQGIFAIHLSSDNCNSTEQRIGGIGSTDKGRNNK